MTKEKETTVPKLSVVMSVYNGEEFVKDAIECILNQTYRDFELILINDGSKDGSLKIMQDYAAKDDRIRIIDQANTGLTIALRRGVDAAKGDYIARMDVDDVSKPTRFEKQMALIEENPSLVAVTTDVQHFVDDGREWGRSRLLRDPSILPLLLVFSNSVGGHGQMVYSRAAYQAVGGYDPDFNYAEDYDLWARLADEGPFARVPEFLYYYRTGHDSVSSLNNDKQVRVAARVAQRQYKNITGVTEDEETFRAMQLFWKTRQPLEVSIPMALRMASVSKRAVDAFFADNPELAAEKYETLRQLAARWWWRARGSEIGMALKAVSLTNAIRLGLAARIAKTQHGGERIDNSLGWSS